MRWYRTFHRVDKLGRHMLESRPCLQSPSSSLAQDIALSRRKHGFKSRWGRTSPHLLKKWVAIRGIRREPNMYSSLLDHVGAKGKAEGKDLGGTDHIRCLNRKLQGQIAAISDVGQCNTER